MATQSKVIIGTVSVVTAIAAATLIALPALAEESTANQSIVDKIATKFNLNKDEVKAVFEQEHQERQAERKTEVAADLQQAVTDGKITADQKTKIEAKMAENQVSRETEMEGLKTWADQQGIEVRYVMGQGHGRGNNLDSAVSSGKISSEQKTSIEAKQAEIEKSHEDKRDAMDQWAKDNGIDMYVLHDYIGGGPGGRGHGDGGGRHLE